MDADVAEGFFVVESVVFVKVVVLRVLEVDGVLLLLVDEDDDDDDDDELDVIDVMVEVDELLVVEDEFGPTGVVCDVEELLLEVDEDLVGEVVHEELKLLVLVGVVEDVVLVVELVRGEELLETVLQYEVGMQ